MNNNAKFCRKITAVIGLALLVTEITQSVRADDAKGFANNSKFTKIDVPGAAGYTAPSGINPQGEIVGTYFAIVNNTVITRGFLLGWSTFRNIDVNLPGAVPGSTNAVAINACGDIVGFYASDNGNIEKGFLLRKGDFASIVAPGSTFTTTTGINLQGDILGFGLANGSAFLLRKGIFTCVNVPGALAGSTFATGINLQDDIVGTYVDSGGNGHGFLLSDGTLTNIDVPGALAGSTSPNGINPEGDIVGSYRDSANNFHSFLLSQGRFTAIDVPATFGIQTDASGINPQGDIVGTYSDGSGNTHGFLLSGKYVTTER